MRFVRIIGVLVDLFFMTILMQLILFGPHKNLSSAFGPVSIALFCVFMVVTLMKDGFKGMGPGKWLLGIQVVDATGSPIGFLGSLKRNVSSLLWPVEAVAILATGKRITDRLLHFEVVRSRRTHWLVRTVVVAVAMAVLTTLDFRMFTSKMLNEEAAIAMKAGILKDSAFAFEIGTVSEFVSLKSGSIYNQDAVFTSKVRTEKGEAEIVSEVRRENGIWIYQQSHGIR